MDQSNCPNDTVFKQNRRCYWVESEQIEIKLIDLNNLIFICFLSLFQNVPPFIGGILRIGSRIENVSFLNCF